MQAYLGWKNGQIFQSFERGTETRSNGLPILQRIFLSIAAREVLGFAHTSLEKPVISERNLLLLLAAVQFTHIMDFMIMMPLGPQLMRELGISAQQFGGLISSFAITAGLVGLAMAPFADRFDRRKLLLFCYAGFTLGSLACGLADSGTTLLWARAVCGAFGGVGGATIMAIIADVVPAERRARGMGIVMTAFSAAAALGVPFGLKLAQTWKWEAPFLVVAGIATLVWIGLFHILPPVRGHLTGGEIRSGKDFLELLGNRNAWIGLCLMMAMVFGHFTIIPYLSQHALRPGWVGQWARARRQR